VNEMGTDEVVARVRACLRERDEERAVAVRVDGRDVWLEGDVDDAELASVCDEVARCAPWVEGVHSALLDDADLCDGDWTAGYEHAGRAR
jgi:hypothetical protein